MNPSRLAANLRQIASKIDNSKKPSKVLVARELKTVLAAITYGDVGDVMEKNGLTWNDSVVDLLNTDGLLEEFVNAVVHTMFGDQEDWTITVNETDYDTGEVIVEGDGNRVSIPYSADMTIDKFNNSATEAVLGEGAIHL